MATPRGAPTNPTPVLVFDVMDTIVLDPFFTMMPSFFGLTMPELLAAKHPTAWVEFERGDISQQELFDKFFKDGRPVDAECLVAAVVAEYRYLPGMQELLSRLNGAGYRLHAMTNYPMWWRYIEDKLELSQYLEWTFVSCEGAMRGLRKPQAESYQCVLRTLGVPGESVIFVDDRQGNVDAAVAAGLDGVRFTDAAQLERQLLQRNLLF